MTRGKSPSLCAAALALTLSLAVWAGPLPAAASAQEAAIGPAPVAGAEGLPDGRAYELVSPIEKNGNEAGAWTISNPSKPIDVGYSVAAREGEAILYRTNGPVGASESGAERLAISRRSAAGWSTTGALPAPVPAERDEPLAQGAGQLDPSADFGRLVFEAAGSYATADPANGTKSDGAFLTGQDISLEPAWVSAPAEPLSEALPEPGQIEAPTPLILAGGSPNLEVVYFSYFGTLLPEDSTRKPYIEKYSEQPWGFYERRDGALKAVGVLPASSPLYPGQLDPHGAVPAGPFDHTKSSNPDAFDNTVSQDGQRAFFVSPDPNARPAPTAKRGAPEGDPTELYVREHGERTLLISRDELNGGAPAPEYESRHAHQGITPTAYPLFEGSNESFAYASPDGSRAFFESQDQLTAQAPAGSEPKTYEFDLEADGGDGSLTYLPEVVGPILASSRDGSRFLFEDTSSSPQRLELWEETSSGSQKLTEVAQLVSAPSRPGIEPVRATADGSMFTFETNDELDPGSFKDGGGFTQVYSYTAPSAGDPSGQLSCLSCLPGSLAPSGDARLSNATEQPGTPQVAPLSRGTPVGSRGMSASGNRVFFDTPEALVKRDVNKVRDVYEWEAPGEGSCAASGAGGCLYLISDGTSPEPSMFLDSSESGADVFFATAEGLVSSDSDEGYDVYDARQPHVPGEAVALAPPPAPAGCVDGECQPASVFSPPPAIFSAATGPSGNLPAPAAVGKAKSKSKAKKSKHAAPRRARKLAKALKRCARLHKRRSARRRCKRRVRRRYRAKSARRGRRHAHGESHRHAHLARHRHGHGRRGTRRHLETKGRSK